MIGWTEFHGSNLASYISFALLMTHWLDRDTTPHPREEEAAKYGVEVSDRGELGLPGKVRLSAPDAKLTRAGCSNPYSCTSGAFLRHFLLRDEFAKIETRLEIFKLDSLNLKEYLAGEIGTNVVVIFNWISYANGWLSILSKPSLTRLTRLNPYLLFNTLRHFS